MKKFFVPIRPVPWSVSTRQSKSPRKKALKNFQEVVAIEAVRSGVKPVDAAIRLQFEFVFKKPKKSRHWYPRRGEPTQMPDLINLTKAAEDALEGVAMDNDTQTYEMAARKRYAVGDEEEGVHVQVSMVREPKRRERRSDKA